MRKNQMRTLLLLIIGLMLGLMLFLTIVSCSPDEKDLHGIYLGAVLDSSGGESEMFLQVQSDKTFTLRNLNYKDFSFEFEKGTWTLDNKVLTLLRDGKKEIRLDYQYNWLRLSASVKAFPDVPLDLLSLRRISIEP